MLYSIINVYELKDIWLVVGINTKFWLLLFFYEIYIYINMCVWVYILYKKLSHNYIFKSITRQISSNLCTLIIEYET